MSLDPASLAPATSPRPALRPATAGWDQLWLNLQHGGSPELAQAASAQAMVLFFWLLVIASLAIWLRRRSAAGDLSIFGNWRRFHVPPDAGGRPPCQWQVGAARMASGAQKWTCETCGRDAFSSTRKPPEGCGWSGKVPAEG